MKKVLFLLYYFPPMGGSGVQRPLKFLKYLPKFGWEPIVLCPDHGAYTQMDASLLDDIEALNIKVVRVANETPLNTAFGRFFAKSAELIKKPIRLLNNWLFIPDNKKNWTIKAVEIGEKLIKDEGIQLIFSSAPPFSSHLAAIELAKRTQTKVVVDYRDAWTNSHLARFPTKWHKNQNINLENRVAKAADAICAINSPILVSVSKGGKSQQLNRVISHGYDQADFIKAAELTVNPKLTDKDAVYFIHNGLFYNERKPNELLKALAMAKKNGSIPKLKLVLQGGLDRIQKLLIEKMRLQEHVIDLGYQTHLQSLCNMMACQATILLIGHKTRPEQIVTGKLYEYIGAQKPIIGLVPVGIAKNILTDYGASYFAKPYDIEQIANTLTTCYKQVAAKEVPPINTQIVAELTRQNQTQKLAGLFDDTLNQDQH